MQFPVATVKKNALYVLADVPHLLKLIRNNFVDHGFMVEGKEINKTIIVQSIGTLKVYTWQVSSIRHIINIVEFATLGGCRSPRHTGE
jgi:hypothetical protein